MNKSESKYFNTAKKMDDALIALLETKPFEYITVKEICEKAGVNRSTFYLHYENTRELLAETVEGVIHNFLGYFSVDTTNITNGFSHCELTELDFTTEEYLHPFLSYVKENYRVFSTALAHGESFGFEGIYQKMFRHIFNPILGRFHYPENDRKYVMMFYLNGICAVVMEWVKDGCNKPIEEVVRVIHSCVYGCGKNMEFHLQE